MSPDPIIQAHALVRADREVTLRDGVVDPTGPGPVSPPYGSADRIGGAW
ncbi:hypothetical protein AB0I55_27670 [Actinocatenispora sera]